MNDRAPITMCKYAGCLRARGFRGLEPGAFLCGNRPVSGKGGAESGAVDSENAPIATDLASVIEAWDSLPSDTRAAIRAVVEAAQIR